MGKSSKDGCCNYIKKLHDAFKLKTHKSYMMKRTLPKIFKNGEKSSSLGATHPFSSNGKTY